MKKIKMLLMGIFMESIRIEKVVTKVVVRVKKNIFLENNHGNRELVKNSRGRGKFRNANLILVNLFTKKSRYGRVFVLMALPNPNQVIKGVLNMPGNKGGNVDLAKQIKLDCTSTTYITVPPLQLAGLATAIQAYDDAHGAALVTTYREMIRLFNLVLRLYQDFADLPANHANAITILQNGGFHVQGVGGEHAAVFGVRNSIVSGEMLLTGPVLKNACHEWWYSADGITYDRIQPSTFNETKHGGLVPGAEAWFKHQLILGVTPQGMSSPIMKVVQ